ncbi:DNA cytosine methyltransferase [Magnetovirga frankeli]|uniref:DNA cytosine methyltransferase n=1 Tax=Magnetovirga frankeli TaxID=947516 RepID=UPI001292EE89|nr:DNA cytosine methyltransferase [gamma proteobacterium SS-5]
MPTFYEFFAGGGMAWAGLGDTWRCLFANDFDPKKGQIYRYNWNPGRELLIADVASLTTDSLPGHADLAWASFPCQDLSLAGTGAGLKGARSGSFWSFWRLMDALGTENRAPPLVVLENVSGALGSHAGQDFNAICLALADLGYRVGALIMDAAHFVPQSRPRLFIVAALAPALPLPTLLQTPAPLEPWHPRALIQAQDRLSPAAKAAWVWWRLPAAPSCARVFADLLVDQPDDVCWHEPETTQGLLQMMSPLHQAKVEQARKAGRRMVGTLYKRTRRNGPNGEKVQRAEIRFDDLAGCLRTPSGGSSRQTVMIVEGNSVRSRLLSSREAARLMGLPDSYTLPKNYNDAYHLAGDGVAVPVVRFLAEHILEPLLAQIQPSRRKAA